MSHAAIGSRNLSHEVMALSRKIKRASPEEISSCLKSAQAFLQELDPEKRNHQGMRDLLLETLRFGVQQSLGVHGPNYFAAAFHPEVGYVPTDLSLRDATKWICTQPELEPNGKFRFYADAKALALRIPNFDCQNLDTLLGYLPAQGIVALPKAVLNGIPGQLVLQNTHGDGKYLRLSRVSSQLGLLE